MASPPRKQSIQWSPPPGDTANQRERRASSARPYRDAPTPHPKKLSDATSYFDGVRDSAGPSPSGRPPTPGPSLRGRPPTPGPRAIPSEPPKTATPEHPRPSGLLRRSSTMDSEVRERHAVEREQVKAGRAALLRRSSSVDSVPRGTETSAPARSFSTLEEGGQRREHRRRSSVVGSIIRFGMNHGVGHGLPTGKLHMHVPELKVASTATLYERDDRESGEASRRSCTTSKVGDIGSAGEILRRSARQGRRDGGLMRVLQARTCSAALLAAFPETRRRRAADPDLCAGSVDGWRNKRCLG